MPQLRLLAVALSAIVAATGAACQLNSDVRVNVTVRHYSLEGGFWAIRGDDSTTYDPLNSLPAEFQQEGLRVFLEGKIRNDLGGIHMAGPIVEIRSIRRL